MKKSFSVISVFVIIASFNFQEKEPKYRNSGLSIDQRVEDLLGRMTVEEKVKQLQCLVFQDVLAENTIGEEGIGGIAFVRIKLPVTLEEEVEQRNKIQRHAMEKTRLGIPILFHCEALHGLVDKGATSFPQAIGLASAWNTELMAKVADAISRETKARGFRQVLSPTVDIARDVRWGRVAETYGEDPYLTSQMAIAFCKSFEDQNVVTTLKHFVANSGPGGRDSHAVHYSERLLREVYFQPYEQAIKKAGVRSVMASYNSIDGVPCGANKWLLTDILRGEWGFDGTVVSDYALLGRMHKSHHIARDEKESAIKVLKAGLDRDLPRIGENNTFYELTNAYKEGLITDDDLNLAVRRVLKQKFELGLFENPYTEASEVSEQTNTIENKELALEAAKQSLVLLKNQQNTLPLNKPKKVLVIGGDAVQEKLGDYSPWDIEVVTILDGIRKEAPEGTEISYVEWKESGYLPVTLLADNGIENSRDGFHAEYFSNVRLEGMPFKKQSIPSIDFNWGSKGPSVEVGNIAQPFSVRYSAKLIGPADQDIPFMLEISGGARVYINEELLFNNWDDPYSTSQKFSYAFEKDKIYQLVVEYNSSGQYSKCILSWDRTMSTNGDEKNLNGIIDGADVVVIVAGVTEKEGQDRASLDIPASMENLIRMAGDKEGTKTVVVFTAGSAITMNSWYPYADAILEAWYPGQEGGTAVAQALFGKYNPGGKLPITFPYSVGQCPIYYNYKPSGRGYGYVDLTGEPRFAFGYGLSYTSFEFSSLRFSKDRILKNENVTVSFNLKNTGKYAGDEVVQLYVNDKLSSVVRPVKELKKFSRVHLKPGEDKVIEFVLSPDDFAMYDSELNLLVEPGEFEIMIGSSSGDISLNKTLLIDWI